VVGNSGEHRTVKKLDDDKHRTFCKIFRRHFLFSISIRNDLLVICLWQPGVLELAEVPWKRKAFRCAIAFAEPAPGAGDIHIGLAA